MRVVLGILFVAHGISKFRMGLGNVAGWFDSVGVPGALAYVIGPLELIGGLLLIVGLFTRYVSALFIIMLLGAILTLKLSAGLLGSGEMAGYELDVAYMLVALYLSVAKPAPLSVDRIFVKSGI
jgi:uncharacterized membrane protein YphA (DoxX/SURF4 family)